VDAPGGDLQLSPGSPALDSGNRNAAGLPTTDLLGQPRISGPGVDMGAYERPSAAPINWANLQWPPLLRVEAGASTHYVITGQVGIDGITSQAGATAGLVAQVGYGPDGSDPTGAPGYGLRGSSPSADPPGWQWVAAAYNKDVGDNDEFVGALTVATPGQYDYCCRFSYNGGPWTYGDLDGSQNGYSPSQAGGITVSSGPIIGWANMQEPPTLTTTAWLATESISGRAWIDGLTSQPGATAGLHAQLGYGPDGSNPSADTTGWQWVDATFNADVGGNDEYVATLTMPVVGEYDYCYRYGWEGEWLYGDLDGTANGYSASQAGALMVQPPVGVVSDRPKTFALAAVGNPFVSAATLRFSLAKADHAQLSVFDPRGRRLALLFHGEAEAGERVVMWDGRDDAGRSVPSGLYLVQLVSGGQVRTVRILRIR